MLNLAPIINYWIRHKIHKTMALIFIIWHHSYGSILLISLIRRRYEWNEVTVVGAFSLCYKPTLATHVKRYRTAIASFWGGNTYNCYDLSPLMFIQSPNLYMLVIEVKFVYRSWIGSYAAHATGINPGKAWLNCRMSLAVWQSIDWSQRYETAAYYLCIRFLGLRKINQNSLLYASFLGKIIEILRFFQTIEVLQLRHSNGWKMFTSFLNRLYLFFHLMYSLES